MTNKQVVRAVKGNSMHWVGDGLPVYNCIDYSDLGKYLNPFIMLDYGAPHEFKPHHKPRGVGMHPHRGFETVTVAFQGEITHTDSTGSTDTIHAGDVQWMTAGSGIEHSEMHSNEFTKTGGTLEMIQLWINLPAKDKMHRPGYQAITKGQIPKVPLHSGNGTVDVIAGQYSGVKGPASTFTPMQLLHVKVEKGSTAQFSFNEDWVAAVMVRRGKVQIDNKRLGERSLAAFSRSGNDITLEALEDSEFLVMAGEPIDEEFVAYGPMVMNTREEIMEAFNDYQKGLFK